MPEGLCPGRWLDPQSYGVMKPLGLETISARLAIVWTGLLLFQPRVLQGCPIGKVGGSGPRGQGSGPWISISLVQALVDRDGAEPQREMVYLRLWGQWVARQDQDSVSGILVSFSPGMFPIHRFLVY